ncbi:MAG TPA: hypothetical protein VGE74_24580 [Gemmata sp.]
MGTDGLFSPVALAVLNEQQYDPTAKGSYELLSGGLIWSNKFPPSGSAEWQLIVPNYLHRYLIAARAAVTLSDGATGFRPIWEQVLRGAPNWPGLQPERHGEAARKRLLAAKRREARCFAEIEQQMSGSQANEPG